MKRSTRLLISIGAVGSLISGAYAVFATDLWICPPHVLIHKEAHSFYQRVENNAACEAAGYEVFNLADFAINLATGLALTAFLIFLLALAEWVNRAPRD